MRVEWDARIYQQAASLEPTKLLLQNTAKTNEFEDVSYLAAAESHNARKAHCVVCLNAFLEGIDDVVEITRLEAHEADASVQFNMALLSGQSANVTRSG